MSHESYNPIRKDDDCQSKDERIHACDGDDDGKIEIEIIEFDRDNGCSAITDASPSPRHPARGQSKQQQLLRAPSQDDDHRFHERCQSRSECHGEVDTRKTNKARRDLRFMTCAFLINVIILGEGFAHCYYVVMILSSTPSEPLV